MEASPKGVFLINVDEAIPAMEGHSGVGVVIRVWENQVVAAISLTLPGNFAVEETEAIAMEQGFVLAHMLGLENIMVEGDALQTIRAVQAKDCKGVAGHIIAGIIQEMSKFQIAVTRHISRNGNKVAHELAKYAKRSGELKSWFGTALEFVADLLRTDAYS